MPRVLGFVLLCAALPALADSISGWGQEVALAPHRGERVPTPTVDSVAIASDGGDRVLVVSKLTTHASIVYGGTDYRLATLLDADGNRLRETVLPGYVVTPSAVLWSGRYFLIFDGLAYTRVTREGEVVDQKPAPAGFYERLSFACNGRRTLIFGRREFNGPYVTYVLDAEAESLTPIEVPVPSFARDVSVAAAGNTFGFVYSTAAGTPTVFTQHIALLGEDGSVPVVDWILSTAHNGAPSIRSDGTTYAVFLRGTADDAIRVLAPDGAVIRANALPVGDNVADSAVPVAVPKRGYLFQQPDGKWKYLDASYGITQIHDQSVAIGGAATTARTSMLVRGGNGVVKFETAEQLKAAFTARTPVHSTESNQVLAAAATNTAGATLVVWREQSPVSGATPEIRALRLDRRGFLADAQPLVIGTGCADSRPTVTTDGADFLVTWNWCTAISAARVSGSGTLLDPTAIRVTLRNGWAHSVIFDGTQYVILWSPGKEVVAARITPGGTLVDTPPRVLFDELYTSSLSLAPAPGGGFVLALLRTVDYAFMTRHLDAGLNLAGPLHQVTAGGAGGPDATLTRSGDRFLLSYPAYPTSGSGFAVEWLDAGGVRQRAAGPLFPVVIPNATEAGVGCDGASCTLLAAPRQTTGYSDFSRSVVALEIRPDEKNVTIATTPVTLAGPTRLALRAVHLAGTPSAPRFVIYERSDLAAGNAVRLFIRRTDARERTVRK